MRSKTPKLFLALILLLGFTNLVDTSAVQVTLAQSSTIATGGTNSYTADLELAQRYVPVLYFHPDEIYLPQGVEVSLNTSRLRQNRRMWFDTTILNHPNGMELSTIPSDETYFLDEWFGDAGSSEYSNYTANQLIYKDTFSPSAGGPAPVTYAHVVRTEDPGHITIQYWFFYFYNDWFNKHEGDWEMAEVIMTTGGKPEWVVYSQHHGGVRRSWETALIEGESHPVAFVARGSHANYFTGNEVYPYGQDVGNRRINVVDRTGYSGRLIPNVILIPTRTELAADPNTWRGSEWLMFRGRWGETGIQGDFSGPCGPADKGAQWEQPYAWGLSQPLDVETWYQNRLQVEITGSATAHARVWLTDVDGQTLPQSESLGNLALLHSEPPDKLFVLIQGTPLTRWDLTVFWPKRASEMVTRVQLSSFKLDASGRDLVELSANETASQEESAALKASESGTSASLFQATFISASDRFALQPTAENTYSAIWDAPNLVWMGDVLPIQNILGGIILALLYSLLPILVFIALLYWVDRYRKEPVRRLGLAFIWGAIPALVLALLLELFFKLPPNLLGPNALEAIRLGLLAPVLEEALKATGVLLIYWCLHREIKDVLDGMIYGAMVGFGFAFIANLLRYAGNFLAWGYPALNLSLVVERTVHALDHGLYAAIFGIGLGLAVGTKTRTQFWARVFGGLGLAITVHALHNLLANSLVGLNVFTVIVTSGGTLVLWAVAGWSLVVQRRLLRRELQGLFHDSLYASVVGPLARVQAQWEALRREGFHAWREVRQLQGLCIKLANARLEARLFPEKHEWVDKADALQAEIKRTLEEMHPILR